MADTKTNLNGERKIELAPENRRALEWLEEDARRQDGPGEEWWDDFEGFLRGHRLKMRCEDEA